MKSHGYNGQLLDRYLASGWYRMGTRMFTTTYNFYDWGFLSTVWTRLPLAGHAFPKRTRKLVRRNAGAFRYEVHRARADAAEEEVFARYCADKAYDLLDTAGEYLHSAPSSPFDTWQCSVYDVASGGLVAFSYFDLGAEAIQSVAGFYDPAYARHSLGLYTLCLEVVWAKANGFAFHYAGYIVPGNDIFEYKRRVGALEAFDERRKVWFPLADLAASDLPDVRQRAALRHYDKLFASLRMSYTVRLRPRYAVSIGQQDLSWLRREQLPFCITEARANRRPYWACHFYSYFRARYFSLLCTSKAFGHERLQVPPELRTAHAPSKRFEHLGSGMTVRLLHETKAPYTAADLEHVWAGVALANENSGP